MSFYLDVFRAVAKTTKIAASAAVILNEVLDYEPLDDPFEELIPSSVLGSLALVTLIHELIE